MALIECSDFSGKLSENANFCPHCGSPNQLIVDKNQRAESANSYGNLGSICWLIGLCILSYVVYQHYQNNLVCNAQLTDSSFKLLFLSSVQVILTTLGLDVWCIQAKHDTVILSRVMAGFLVAAVLFGTIKDFKKD